MIGEVSGEINREEEVNREGAKSAEKTDFSFLRVLRAFAVIRFLS
jgi:hypothetical protein